MYRGRFPGELRFDSSFPLELDLSLDLESSASRSYTSALVGTACRGSLYFRIRERDQLGLRAIRTRQRAHRTRTPLHAAGGLSSREAVLRARTRRRGPLDLAAGAARAAGQGEVARTVDLSAAEGGRRPRSLTSRVRAARGGDEHVADRGRDFQLLYRNDLVRAAHPSARHPGGA